MTQLQHYPDWTHGWRKTIGLKTKTKTIGRNTHGGHKGSLGEAREAVGGLAASV